MDIVRTIGIQGKFITSNLNSAINSVSDRVSTSKRGKLPKKKGNGSKSLVPSYMLGGMRYINNSTSKLKKSKKSYNSKSDIKNNNKGKTKTKSKKK